METDCAGFGEFNRISKQVVHNLFNADRIAIQPDFRILEITDKPDAFVVGYMRESRSSTLQHFLKVERDIPAFLVRLVQVIHIQQVVEKVYHMEAFVPDVFQENVPLYFLLRFHGQFKVPGYDAQRGLDVVRQGKDDTLAHIEECRILFDCFLQLFFRPCFFS